MSGDQSLNDNVLDEPLAENNHNDMTFAEIAYAELARAQRLIDGGSSGELESEQNSFLENFISRDTLNSGSNGTEEHSSTRRVFISTADNVPSRVGWIRINTFIKKPILFPKQ